MVRPVVAVLMLVAAAATIASQRVHGPWARPLDVVIGLLWISAAGSVFAPLAAAHRRRLDPGPVTSGVAGQEPAPAAGDAAAEATLRAGVRLARRHDIAGARAAFEQVIESGPPGMAAAAAFDLGLLHHTHDNMAAARAAYERAVSSGHPQWRPQAANNLAQVLLRAGDIDGARAAHHIALDSGHPKQARIARRALARLPSGGPARTQ